MPDQIEAGTFLAVGAISSGDITIKNVIPNHLNCITYKLMEMGCDIKYYVHEPHGKPWGVWQHALVVNSLMCNETIQTSRRETLALR